VPKTADTSVVLSFLLFFCEYLEYRWQIGPRQLFKPAEAEPTIQDARASDLDESFASASGDDLAGSSENDARFGAVVRTYNPVGFD
jgi:hypothetical protein